MAFVRSLENIEKQGYEEFTVSVDFSINMVADETITSETVSAINSSDADATDVITDQGTVQSVGQKVLVLVKGGIEADSKYKLTFRCVTSKDHKWEFDMTIEIKEK